MIKKILLALYSTLLMFGLTLTASAKSLRCEYIIKTEGTPSIHAGQDFGVIFTIDENDVFTKELKIPKDIQNRSIMGADADLVSKSDFIDDNGKLKCDNKIYYYTYNKDRGSIRVYSFKKERFNSTASYISELSKSKEDIKQDSETQNVTKNVCRYGDYTVTLFSNGEKYAEYKGKGAVIKDNYSKNTCPSSIWAVQKNATGGGVNIQTNEVYFNNPSMGTEIKLNSVNDKPSDSGSTGNEKKPTNPTTSTSEIGVRKLQDNFCNKTAGIWQLVGYALMALKIIIPIIIIVLGVVNFSKAAIVSDKDAIKKASITLLQKLIFGICIFFVPTIVNLLVSLISDFAGNQDSVGVCQYCLLDPLSSTCKNVINSNK